MCPVLGAKMTKSGSGFTEDQVAEFQEAFALFDTRGDGMIPVTVVGINFEFCQSVLMEICCPI